MSGSWARDRERERAGFGLAERLHALGRAEREERARRCVRTAVQVNVAAVAVLALVLVPVAVIGVPSGVLLGCCAIALTGCLGVAGFATQRGLDRSYAYRRLVYPERGYLELALERLGGAGELPAYVLDGSLPGVPEALGPLAVEWVAAQELPDGAHEVRRTLVREGFAGTLGELVAVCRSLG